MSKRILVIAAMLVLALPFASVLAQDAGTIVDVAAGSEDFSTLVSLVEAAGLTDTLAGEGPFTVFAPTNEAFAKLPQPVVDYLLANPDLLTRVLTYHVIPGALTAANVLAAPSLTTAEGSDLTVNAALSRVNGATIVSTDVAASNGVIHAIDSVVLPTIELPAVDPLAVADNIIAAGSSTVYPVTERMADLFNQDGFGGTITVDSIGSGAGYERFCVNAETDIANASRPIRDAEAEACASNGRTPIEYYIAVDALAVVVSAENTFVDSLSIEQLNTIFSGAAATWADVNPEWPAEAIRLFSPGTDSGTFDYFVEVVFDEDETPILNAPGIQLSEDDNVLVAGVEGSPYAIGYFGYAYYVVNQDRLRAVSIEGIEPNAATAESGEYPLSRPLFIYSDATIMAEKPQVAAFINYYLSSVEAQLGTNPGQIGYFPVNSDVLNLDRLEWLAATAGGM
jgi:phosphate binding protein